MTRPSRPWKFPERRRLAIAALFLAFVALKPARRAHAQACCAGGAVVSPARLALHEDWAVGVQVRARSNGGSFDPGGTFSQSSGLEQIFEQDLVASVRLAGAAQAGVLVPMIQTHRSAAGLDDWGGGIGDVSLTARYDFLLAAQSRHWPGVAALAAATLPTGRPTDQATSPLAADATGTGAADLTVGVALEKVIGRHGYAAVNGWATHKFSRHVTSPGALPLVESFSTRWTALAVGGYVFDSEAALGLYVSEMNEGSATLNGAQDSNTKLRLTTVGAAAVLPMRDVWRLQASLFWDVVFSGFGRNEPAGSGATASLVRVWL